LVGPVAVTASAAIFILAFETILEHVADGRGDNEYDSRKISFPALALALQPFIDRNSLLRVSNYNE
jgi:hypothetical protein